MRIMGKIAIILVALLCLNVTYNLNMPKVEATVGGDIATVGNDVPNQTVEMGNFSNVIKRILGMLRTLTGLLSILVIAYTGFQMVTENAEGKAKIKEKMLPIVIGVVLTFMATIIATFIVGLFE